MKKYMTLLAALPLMAACGEETTSGDGSDTHLREDHITLNDGRTITCVLYQQGYAGGLSCDWSGTK